MRYGQKSENFTLIKGFWELTETYFCSILFKNVSKIPFPNVEQPLKKFGTIAESLDVLVFEIWAKKCKFNSQNRFLYLDPDLFFANIPRSDTRMR